MARAIAIGMFGLIALAPACGNKPSPPPAPDHRDARTADAEVAADLPDRPLGLPDLSAYRWRKRPGQAAFRLARRAEDSGDWATVVATCTQALAADPDHLDAAWLLAVAHAKLGQLDRVLAPLAQAVAGDFGKWGPASLELPALRAFLATPTGEAWRRRVEQDRARYTRELARSLVVAADGDLFAIELAAGRWHRLTRTTGTVIGALAIAPASRIAYVSRTRQAGKHDLGIGVIDLAQGKSSRPVSLASAGPIALAYSARPPIGFWIGSGAPRALAWRQLDDEYHLHAQPARAARPPGPWLDVTAKGTVHLHALPAGITADWDDQSLASAIRIGNSGRVVSVPSPGLIDGNTAAWSPDRVHLAFVAQLDDHCAPGAVNTAAFIADASTGGTRELERAARGIALVWLADRTLAIAGDHGVSIRSLDDAVPPVTIDGATGLLIPRERPRCAPVEAADEPPSDELDLPEPAAGDEPPDAGVIDRR